MRSIFITVCIIALGAGLLMAQPEIDLLRLYDRGNTVADLFSDVYLTAENDYYVCGQSAYNPWVVRLDREGEVLWEYNEDGVRLFSIIQADNGDAVTVGAIGGDRMFGAVRLSPEGELNWRREYIRGRANAVIELKNGNFLICGTIFEDNGRRRGYVITINHAGDPVWERRYGEEDVELHLEAMRETEGGVVLVGWTSTHSWILKISIDEEGNVIWSRSYDLGDQRLLYFRSIVSTEFGFAIGGIHSGEQGGFALYLVDEDGDLREEYLYENGAWFECLNKLSDGGYILVGYRATGRIHYPIALRTDTDGNIRWTQDFSEIVDEQQQPQQEYLRNQLYSVIVQPDDVIVASGCMFNNEIRERSGDGLLVRFEPDQLQPIIFYWLPEDTVLSVLPGDSVEFIVRARDQQGDELSYLWITGEDTLSQDTTVTVHFEEFGDYEVQCQASDGEWTTTITWHINAVEWFIDAYQPDSLDLICRRNETIDFSVTVRMVDDDPPMEYFWFLDDDWLMDGDDFVDDDSVSVTFNQGGREHRIEAIASRGEDFESVVWDVLIQELIVDWWPSPFEMTVPVDTAMQFVVDLFDPEADSLSIVWTLNDDTISSDVSVFLEFDEVGQYQVVAYALDEHDNDTLTWDVLVVDPDAVDDGTGHHIPDQVTLYPPVPNPFNSQTTISYSLPKAGMVRLQLYDITGRLVFTLDNRYITAGEHSTAINGNMMTSGIYIVRMVADGETFTQKILLVK